MIDILETITMHREARGWTEYLLAEKAGIPQSTISSWYKKQMLPSIASLDKICQGFDISMAQFFAGANESYPLSQQQRTLLDTWATLSAQQQICLLQLMQTISSAK